jgi:GT2 family glycosyltransferase
MKKIVIVILHYNLLDDTIACIETIKKRSSEVNIIIVDNFSPNGSGKTLDKKYIDDEKVQVILSNENLGFARGNNLGFSYAVKNMNPDFIILSNNDVLIEQDDFFSKMINIFEQTQFAVCGPDILVPYSGVHQNPPSNMENYTIDDLNNQILRCEKELEFYRGISSSKFKRFFYDFYKSIRVSLKKYRGKFPVGDFKSGKVDIKIHGAFMIFSKKYFDVFSAGLYPNTFMYGEESILYYLCLKAKLKIIYSPQIQILHMEGKSTRQSMGNSNFLEKNIFYLSNRLDSLNSFKNLVVECGEIDFTKIK